MHGQSGGCAAILRTYFHAKDENRPHLLEQGFAGTARLQVINRSEAIAFPAAVEGREAIADVLVRRFNQAYENIYSYYLARPADGLASFACGWLVVMTDKADRRVRVGAGQYDWTFTRVEPRLAAALTITIATMELLDAAAWPDVRAWIGALDYPWTSARAALATAPQLPALQPVRDWLASQPD